MRFYADTGTRILVIVTLLAMFLLGRRFPRAVVGWMFGVIGGGLLTGAPLLASGAGVVGGAIGFALDARNKSGRPTRRR